jgi:two-component system, NtrC family, response regulator HydG
MLAQEFLSRHGETTSRTLSPEVAAMMVRYSWPGNVRELMNAVERAVTLSTGAQLGVADFPERMQNRTLAVPPPADATDVSTLLPLAEVERRYVMSVLEQVQGNKRRAAQILGLDRSTLYRRLKDFGVKDDGKDV